MSVPTLLSCDDRAITLGTVLQALDLEAATGVIEVAGGTVGLRDGSVVSATLGSWGGLDAFHELFLRPVGGGLVVRAREPDGSQPLGPTAGLVLEAARRVDEWRRIGGHVLARKGDVEAGSRTEPADLEVLRAPDSRRAVWQLADDLGRPRSRVVHLLAPWVATGALAPTGVVRPPPGEAAGPAVGDGDAWAALDHGRSLLRQGLHDEARRAFERALALRPDDRVVAQNLRRLERLAAAEVR